ncbi:single-stranded DNA-binding protein [uncultured Cellulomonas sp.]|uniref:single-stranded DNA-binding protein n=1 Tax=uncultured Cellulomonas sp. TaxID=189682 RepID=UPI00261B65D7|nr:single-stranded DNA-binding protein [uncultured Cellulomonas sp.]
MSTSDPTLTLVGWVGTEPRHYTGATVTPFTSFRMATTRRWFDRTQNTWVDGRTEWFTVKSWRQSALNVAGSLRKGDPVLVHGRLATEQWDGPDGPRTSLVLEALAIGPDLTYGRASFARTVHVTSGHGDSGGAGGAGGGGAGGDGTGSTDAADLGLDDPWATDVGGPPPGIATDDSAEGDAIAEGDSAHRTDVGDDVDVLDPVR